MITSGTVRWAQATRTYEGWEPGNRAFRNNSPGDFRWTPFIASLGATGKDAQNFAIFPTADIGFAALLQFLQLAESNQLIAYRAHARLKGRPGNMCTLGDFYEVYAPTSDKNAPARYAIFVADYIGNGVSVDTPINQIK